MSEIIVEGTRFGSIRVEPFDVKTTPGQVKENGQSGKAVFVHFSIQWAGWRCQRGQFIIPVPPGKEHFELVVEGTNLQKARIGLQPYQDGRPDLEGKIYWAEPFEEDVGLSQLVVIHEEGTTKVYPTPRAFGEPLIEWQRGAGRCTIQHSPNRTLTRLSRPDVIALIGALQTFLGKEI